MAETEHLRETIVAIATPPGRGGIGIVRLSGPDAVRLAMPLLVLDGALEPGRARLCDIVDPMAKAGNGAGVRLDEAVATYYRAPRSYTGEDVVEIAAHGAPVILEFLLRETMARGARLAEPGEFTERAFLAGRLDLTQAEAVRDLIEAQTLYQARIAASQLDGALSRRVRPVKARLFRLIAQIEAGIDFAEDDTPTLASAELEGALGEVLEQLAELAGSFVHGRLVHKGLTLAIVGEPNVGKSSLFNRLVERERAIVTSAPGTTRDLVMERISLAGIPVEVVDTAGLREGTLDGPLDEAERIGIARSREALGEADLVLLVVEASQVLAADEGISRQVVSGITVTGGRSMVIALNKCDLLATQGAFWVQEEVQRELLQFAERMGAAGAVFTSATTGEGLGELRGALERQLQVPVLGEQAGMLTSMRQHQAVQSAEEFIQRARGAARDRVPDEMLLLDMYGALRALDDLTGQTTPEDILRHIFSSFCIGK